MLDDNSRRVLTVVLVSYNSASVILNALRPLVGESDIELLVVDNASQDSTIRDVERLFPSVKILPLDSNVGFAKAVNLGILSCSSPCVMLLNPDAVVTAAEVRMLLSSVSDGAGIVAPLITEPGERLEVVSAGGFPTVWRMFLHFSALARFSKGHKRLQGHYLFPANLAVGPMPVDWVTGACMLFTRETWKRAGGLSERWFMYAEDIDFCFRVKALGLTVVLIPSISATHLVGQSDSTASFSANPAWILNLHDFYDSELSPSAFHSLVWCWVVALGLMSRSMVFRIRGLSEGRNSLWHTEAKRFRVFALALIKRGILAPRRAV